MKHTKKNRGKQKSKGTKKGRESSPQRTISRSRTEPLMSSAIVTHRKSDVSIEIDPLTPLLPKEEDSSCGCYEIQSYAVATIAAGVALGSIAAALWIFYQIIIEGRSVDRIFPF